MKTTDKTELKPTSLPTLLKTAREELEAAKVLNGTFEALIRDKIRDAEQNRTGWSGGSISGGLLHSEVQREQDRESALMGIQAAYQRIGDNQGSAIATIARIEEECANETIQLHGVEAASACGAIDRDLSSAISNFGHLVSGAQACGSKEDSEAALKHMRISLKSIQEAHKLLAAMRITGSELGPTKERVQKLRAKRSDYMKLRAEYGQRLETLKQSIDLRDQAALAEASNLLAAIAVFPERLAALNGEVREAEQDCQAGCEGFFQTSLRPHVLELESRIINKVETGLRAAFSDPAALRQAVQHSDPLRALAPLKNFVAVLDSFDPARSIETADQLMQWAKAADEFEKQYLN